MTKKSHQHYHLNPLLKDDILKAIRKSAPKGYKKLPAEQQTLNGHHQKQTRQPLDRCPAIVGTMLFTSHIDQARRRDVQPYHDRCPRRRRIGPFLR